MYLHFSFLWCFLRHLNHSFSGGSLLDHTLSFLLCTLLIVYWLGPSKLNSFFAFKFSSLFISKILNFVWIKNEHDNRIFILVDIFDPPTLSLHWHYKHYRRWVADIKHFSSVGKVELGYFPKAIWISEINSCR